MKYVALVLSAFFLISCHTEPQPLVVGKDECYFCKMPVADIKFGGEIITAKGKLYKFDDLGCMINFLKRMTGDKKAEQMLGVNYNNQKLIDVQKAVFLKNPNLHSPMNSGIAVFASRSEAEPMMKDSASEILTWQQLYPDSN